MEGCSPFLGRDPGIYNDAQVAGWRKKTDAVHAAGGQIVVQIWHGGRACHPIFNNGAQPVAPSTIENEGFATALPMPRGIPIIPNCRHNPLISHQAHKHLGSS
jgi:N-ethylmaleimide reductase